jgi:hypothetical protein
MIATFKSVLGVLREDEQVDFHVDSALRFLPNVNGKKHTIVFQMDFDSNQYAIRLLTTLASDPDGLVIEIDKQCRDNGSFYSKLVEPRLLQITVDYVKEDRVNEYSELIPVIVATVEYSRVEVIDTCE